MEEEWEKVGEVFTYFSKAGVAGVKVTGDVNVGDEIWVKGHTTDFKQKVDSMQIDRNSIQKASPGQTIGLKVAGHVRHNDVVYRKKIM